MPKKLNRKFLNVGSCIYCGENNGPLTREHIIPRGLGGNISPNGLVDALVLKNASCQKCQEITKKIEDKCLTKMMDTGRAKLGLKRKDRAGSTAKGFLRYEGGLEIIKELGWSKIPGVVTIPHFYDAGAVTNEQTVGVPKCDYKVIVVSPASAKVSDDVKGVGVEVSADSITFGQMLAKIALGLAVARYGVGEFVPFVRDFILSSPEQCGYWVGGYAGKEIDLEKTKNLNETSVGTYKSEAGEIILVKIRFFAEFGGPMNYVVVGKLN